MVGSRRTKGNDAGARGEKEVVEDEEEEEPRRGLFSRTLKSLVLGVVSRTKTDPEQSNVRGEIEATPGGDGENKGAEALPADSRIEQRSSLADDSGKARETSPRNNDEKGGGAPTSDQNGKAQDLDPQVSVALQVDTVESDARQLRASNMPDRSEPPLAHGALSQTENANYSQSAEDSHQGSVMTDHIEFDNIDNIDLDRLTYNQLRHVCRHHGLGAGGKKKDMKIRIRSHQRKLQKLKASRAQEVGAEEQATENIRPTESRPTAAGEARSTAKPSPLPAGRVVETSNPTDSKKVDVRVETPRKRSRDFAMREVDSIEPIVQVENSMLMSMRSQDNTFREDNREENKERSEAADLGLGYALELSRAVKRGKKSISANEFEVITNILLEGVPSDQRDRALDTLPRIYESASPNSKQPSGHEVRTSPFPSVGSARDKGAAGAGSTRAPAASAGISTSRAPGQLPSGDRRPGLVVPEPGKKLPPRSPLEQPIGTPRASESGALLRGPAGKDEREPLAWRPAPPTFNAASADRGRPRGDDFRTPEKTAGSIVEAFLETSSTFLPRPLGGDNGGPNLIDSADAAFRGGVTTERPTRWDRRQQSLASIRRWRKKDDTPGTQATPSRKVAAASTPATDSRAQTAASRRILDTLEKLRTPTTARKRFRPLNEDEGQRGTTQTELATSRSGTDGYIQPESLVLRLTPDKRDEAPRSGKPEADDEATPAESRLMRIRRQALSKMNARDAGQLEAAKEKADPSRDQLSLALKQKDDVVRSVKFDKSESREPLFSRAVPLDVGEKPDDREPPRQVRRSAQLSKRDKLRRAHPKSKLQPPGRAIQEPARKRRFPGERAERAGAVNLADDQTSGPGFTAALFPARKLEPDATTTTKNEDVKAATLDLEPGKVSQSMGTASVPLFSFKREEATSSSVQRSPLSDAAKMFTAGKPDAGGPGFENSTAQGQKTATKLFPDNESTLKPGAVPAGKSEEGAGDGDGDAANSAEKSDEKGDDDDGTDKDGPEDDDEEEELPPPINLPISLQFPQTAMSQPPLAKFSFGGSEDATPPPAQTQAAASFSFSAPATAASFGSATVTAPFSKSVASVGQGGSGDGESGPALESGAEKSKPSALGAEASAPSTKPLTTASAATFSFASGGSTDFKFGAVAPATGPPGQTASISFGATAANVATTPADKTDPEELSGRALKTELAAAGKVPGLAFGLKAKAPEDPSPAGPTQTSIPTAFGSRNGASTSTFGGGSSSAGLGTAQPASAFKPVAGGFSFGSGAPQTEEKLEPQGTFNVDTSSSTATIVAATAPTAGFVGAATFSAASSALGAVGTGAEVLATAAGDEQSGEPPIKKPAFTGGFSSSTTSFKFGGASEASSIGGTGAATSTLATATATEAGPFGGSSLSASSSATAPLFKFDAASPFSGAPFGSGAPASVPFDSNAKPVSFGSTASFGNSSAAAAFGAASAAVFGASGAAFGSSSAAAFGSSSAPAFGSSSGAAFGSTAPAPAFGGSAPAPAFGGSAPAAAFGGSAPAAAFGDSAPAAAFGGSAPAPAFGGSASTPAFGGSASSAAFGGSAPAPGFGSSSAPTFGSPMAPTFSSSPANAFTSSAAPTFSSGGPAATFQFGQPGAPISGSSSMASSGMFGAPDGSAPVFGGAAAAPASGADGAGAPGGSAFFQGGLAQSQSGGFSFGGAGTQQPSTFGGVFNANSQMGNESGQAQQPSQMPFMSGGAPFGASQPGVANFSFGSGSDPAQDGSNAGAGGFQMGSSGGRGGRKLFRARRRK